MSTTEFNLDTVLSNMVPSIDGALRSDDGGSEGTSGEPWQEPGYEGKIDYRIRQLSYSSLLALHSCPRKYQLYKLGSKDRTADSEKSTITFSYGHVVGQGIQELFMGLPIERIIFNMFTAWHTDLYAVDEKMNKSFPDAVLAIQKLAHMRSIGFLSEYEIVEYNGKPAAELSFAINFPDGFRLRGFVDAVLKHKTTGKVIVLECKTTGSANLHPAMYKNSAQAIGYSIVLDALFPELSSYEVLYLVYQTKAREYEILPFEKTYLQRALWIRELLLDIETIKMYEEAEVYPMHGESCYSFFRECEYFQVCTLSTKYLTKPATESDEDKTEYQIQLSLENLLDTQLAKLT